MVKKFRSPFCFALAALVFSVLPLACGIYLWDYSQKVDVPFTHDWRYILEVFGFYSPLISGIACALVGLLILKRKPEKIRRSSRTWFCYALCTCSAILVVLSPKYAGYFIFLFPLAAIFFSGSISAVVVSIVVGCLVFVARVTSPDTITLSAILGTGAFLRCVTLAFIVNNGARRGGTKSILLSIFLALLVSWCVNFVSWNTAIRTVYPSAPMAYMPPLDAAASLLFFAALSALLLFISARAHRSKPPAC